MTYIMEKIFACSLFGMCVREREKEVEIEGGEEDKETIIGMSVNELHTSELNCDFSYNLVYIIPYILDAVI